MKPRLYLAGKIGKNDWRHPLVPGLRGHEWKDGPIVTPTFQYVGPFFVSCDHGWNHGSNTHGAAAVEIFDQSPYNQLDVIQQNNKAMDQADLFFAYITATDCHGTEVELGRATAPFYFGRVVVAFAPTVPADDFWYGALQADALHYNVRECCLPALLAAELEVVQGIRKLSGK